MVKYSYKRTPKPCSKPSPEELKLLLLQRVGQHHTKPYGLRMGCYANSYACKDRRMNTFGNIVYFVYDFITFHLCH